MLGLVLTHSVVSKSLQLQHFPLIQRQFLKLPINLKKLLLKLYPCNRVLDSTLSAPGMSLFVIRAKNKTKQTKPNKPRFFKSDSVHYNYLQKHRDREGGKMTKSRFKNPPPKKKIPQIMIARVFIVLGKRYGIWWSKILDLEPKPMVRP